MNKIEDIIVIGLGYVGLPLCTYFIKAGLNVIGFDIDNDKIIALKKGINYEEILTEDELKNLKKVSIVNNLNYISKPCFYIVTVPTPVSKNKEPDFKPLINASKEIGKIIKPDDIVIYESTVYPGATREICLPSILSESTKRGVEKFGFGYSPERVNPGDTENTIENITKIVSGSDPNVLESICSLYSKIVKKGVYKTQTIEEAEASKITENIQRDVNIALMNELDMIFKNQNISTKNVIEAASTKWNFMKFSPGLVGGHCIGIDPYYMIYLAKRNNIRPSIIESSRYTNEGYSNHVYNNFLIWLLTNGFDINIKNPIFFGITFKPNCADIRNSKYLELFEKIKKVVKNIKAYDPIILNCDIEKPDYIVVGSQHNDLGKMKAYFEDESIKKFNLVNLK